MVCAALEFMRYAFAMIPLYARLRETVLKGCKFARTPNIATGETETNQPAHEAANMVGRPLGGKW